MFDVELPRVMAAADPYDRTSEDLLQDGGSSPDPPVLDAVVSKTMATTQAKRPHRVRTAWMAAA